jgi:hypothetical protein
MVVTRPKNDVDLAGLRRHMGSEELKPFLITREIKQVWVKLKTEVGDSLPPIYFNQD